MSAVASTSNGAGNGAAHRQGAGAAAIAPPHNLDAEQSVLGAILLSDRSLYALVIEEGLRPEDFYRERHGAIYEAMLALYNEIRARGRADGHRPPAPGGQARGGRRSGGGGRADRASSRPPATPAATRRSCARTRCCGGC